MEEGPGKQQRLWNNFEKACFIQFGSVNIIYDEEG
jgi:hypothetical protein